MALRLTYVIAIHVNNRKLYILKHCVLSRAVDLKCSQEYLNIFVPAKLVILLADDVTPGTLQEDYQV